MQESETSFNGNNENITSTITTNYDYLSEISAMEPSSFDSFKDESHVDNQNSNPIYHYLLKSTTYISNNMIISFFLNPQW